MAAATLPKRQRLARYQATNGMEHRKTKLADLARGAPRMSPVSTAWLKRPMTSSAPARPTISEARSLRDADALLVSDGLQGVGFDDAVLTQQVHGHRVQLGHLTAAGLPDAPGLLGWGCVLLSHGRSVLCSLAITPQWSCL